MLHKPQSKAAPSLRSGMVGAGGDDSRALLALRSDAAVGQRRGQQWEVEFARYFTAPPGGPSTAPPPGVRYAFRPMHRHPGAWIHAAAPAALRVSRTIHASAAPVLTVSIDDVVFEEHFLSILNFSWPQVTCMTECLRGSRLVFVSFWDKYKQIQKFALRFPLISDAESFLNCVKECLGDIIPSGSGSVCEDSSTSEYIASNELQHSFEELASDHRTEAPALFYHEEPGHPAFEPLRAAGINNVNSGFPPSCTKMLTNLSAENEIDVEDGHPLTGKDHPQKECLGDTMEIMTLGSDYVCEDSSASEYVTSSRLHHRPDDASSFEEPASDYVIEAPALCYHEKPDQTVSEPLQATNNANIVSGFPLSFTEMLTKLSTEKRTNAEHPHPLTGTDHPHEVYTHDTRHDVDENAAGKQIDTSKSTDDIMARIKTYLADDSFHEMLFRLERVIDELGMDLSL